MKTFSRTETVDFAVVGSGAAGGVMARELSQAGFSVVLLEQGPRLGPGDFEHDELKYIFLNGILNDPVRCPQTFTNDPRKPAQRTSNSNVPAVRTHRRRKQQSLHRQGAFTRSISTSAACLDP